MGGSDNYKIREANREFVYIVLRMMIAKEGYEGILRNQTLGEEVCSTQAYELSMAKLQSFEKSLKASKNKEFWKGIPA